MTTSSSAGQNKVRTPDRQDQFVLNFYGRHRRLRSSILLNGQEFSVLEESLTRAMTNPVTRAVYYMTALRNLRLLTSQLEQEVRLMGRAMRESGVMLEPDFPSDLRNFLILDEEVQSTKPIPASHMLNHETVTLSAHQIVGLRTFL